MDRIDSALSLAIPGFADEPPDTQVAGAPLDGVMADVAVDHDDPLSLYQQLKRGTDEIKAAVKASRPKLEEATGQYFTGRGTKYLLDFDRPVTLQEAERALFTDGKRPPQNKEPGHTMQDDNEEKVGLRPVGGTDGRATTWELYMPRNHPNAYKSLASGVDEEIVKAPRTMPVWVQSGTREVMNTGELPRPGDPRFEAVKDDFPHPYEQVVVWREGNTMWRYDGATGQLDGYYERRDERMGGFYASMNRYVMGEGRPVGEARKQTQQDFHEYSWDAMTQLAIGSVG